jgi:benzoyl-CoA 2,3-dioxygenase component B
MNELKTDDVNKLRAAGVIDLPTIQRYINFHFSVTIDLFGADQSSNAATFYSSGLKGRYEEGKRTDDHVLKGNTYKILDVVNGQLVEKEVPMLNALNEVLRDDYIKDSVGGVDRWNRLIEKAGIPFKLTVPHKAFHRSIGTLAGVKVSPDGRVVSEAGVERQGRRVAAVQRRPRLRRQPDGSRRRAGQVRQLDRAAGHGHQPPAGGF